MHQKHRESLLLMEGVKEKKMKVLCLHGFRTSGAFLKKQISKWDPSIFQEFDMVFPDGLFPAGGKSDIEGIFPPPYFEWFQFNKEFTEYINLEECISHLCNYMTANGPFDGLLGFSQGATLSALLIGYQAQDELCYGRTNSSSPLYDVQMKILNRLMDSTHQNKGKVLKDHQPIKFLVSVSGSKFRDPRICDVAYKDPIKSKSVHFIGEKDWLKVPSEELAAAFDSPLLLRHPQGHTVPRLDENAVKLLAEWTKSIVQDTVTNSTCNVEKSKDVTKEATKEPPTVSVSI